MSFHTNKKLMFFEILIKEFNHLSVFKKKWRSLTKSWSNVALPCSLLFYDNSRAKILRLSIFCGMNFENVIRGDSSKNFVFFKDSA